jgi:hypothetical protein
LKAIETTVLRLLQGSKVFLIPNFQRRYAWRQTQWEEFWEDLLREYDSASDSHSQELQGHFLGSVVLHPAPGRASTLMRHLVIDGQQRLTTILVLLAALRDARVAHEPGWNPAAYDAKYLTNPYDEDYPDRLVPTEFDRSSYVETIRNGVPTGGLGQAYTYFRGQIERAKSEQRIDLAQLGDTLLMRMLLVEITASAGDSVNNIFNRLNSKGLPLSATDLIRNELLLNLGEGTADRAYKEIWLPMERGLVAVDGQGGQKDTRLVTFFWAREVAHSPSTTKKNLFQSFERNLRSRLDSVPISDREQQVLYCFGEIERDYRIFRILLDPTFPEPGLTGISAEVRDALSELNEWASEPYVPIALSILRWCADGVVSPNEAADALRMLLGYLVRRALVGLATNNLNRMLSPIPSYLAAHVERVGLKRAMREALSRPGYQWPTDRDVSAGAPLQPVFFSIKRNQTRFILRSVEHYLSGRRSYDGRLSIMHVMPSSLTVPWAEYLTSRGVDLDDASSAVNRIGNLTLTTASGRSSGRDFVALRDVLSDSPFEIAREVARFDSWTPNEIHERGQWMSQVLIRLFVGPEGGTGAMEGERLRSVRDDLVSALQSLPDGDWTTEPELGRYLGLRAVPLRGELTELGPELLRLVRTFDGEIPGWFQPTLRRAISNQLSEEEEFQAGIARTAEDISKLVVGEWPDRDALTMIEDGSE